MTTAPDVVKPATDIVATIVREATDVDLDAASTCGDWTVRELVDHWAGTTKAMARLGAGEALDPENPWGGPAVSGGDWQAVIVSNLSAIADGWSRPEAWEGQLDAGGRTMPAAALGDMMLVEVLLHGWDLAVASGQELSVPAEVGEQAQRIIDETGDWGREMHVYGPAVDVPSDASAFDQALAGAGRDPSQGRSG